MTKDLKELIQGYIERCIPDIARKCACNSQDVWDIMYDVSKNNISKSSISIPMDKTIQMEGHDYTFEEVIALFSE